MEAKSKEWEIRSRRNVRQLAYWTGSWVASMAIAAFGPKFLWDYNSGITILFIAINTLIGLGMILMNRKYLNGLDEMHRKVSMDAMAIALGIGVIVGLSLSMLDQTKVISFKVDIAHLVILIGLTYLIGIQVGYMRYK